MGVEAGEGQHKAEPALLRKGNYALQAAATSCEAHGWLHRPGLACRRTQATGWGRRRGRRWLHPAPATKCTHIHTQLAACCGKHVPKRVLTEPS